MSDIPAIEGYKYDDIKHKKLDSTKCRLKQCDALATNNCSKSQCKHRFCYKHATHNHYLCAYCPDGEENFAFCEILIDNRLACKKCSDYLLKTRVCPKCEYWMSESHASRFRYCYDCLPKCVLCKKCISNNNYLRLCSSCDSTQRACHTQGISGYYGQFK